MKTTFAILALLPFWACAATLSLPRIEGWTIDQKSCKESLASQNGAIIHPRICTVVENFVDTVKTDTTLKVPKK